MRNLRTITAMTAIALSLAACGTADEVGGDSFNLNTTLGVSCGDAVFYFTTTDGTQQLAIQIPGLSERAGESSTLSETYDIEDDRIDATFLTGTDLGEAACNDALSAFPTVTSELPAVSGSVTVEVKAIDTNQDQVGPMGLHPALVTLRIDSLEFDGVSIASPYEITEMPIGWLPG